MNETTRRRNFGEIESPSIDYVPTTERHGKVGAQGPVLGMPQMMQSQAQFGHRGLNEHRYFHNHQDCLPC